MADRSLKSQDITFHEVSGGRFEPGQASVTEMGSRSPKVDSPTAEYPEVAEGTTRTAIVEPQPEPVPQSRPEPALSTGTPGAAARGFRALFWLVAAVGLVMALVFGAQAVGWLPQLKNPFASKTVDRSQPVLLKSIQDLSRYVAAEGTYEAVIDVQKDRKNVPDFLLNDRILFVANGSVEAYVDFANIGQGAITESADHRTVEIKLPAPQLGKPNIDNKKSYVFAIQRGLFNRVSDLFSGDPNRLQEVYVLAEDRIAAAARDNALADRAQANTRKMLEGMLHSLGYTSVTITFAAA
jgi:uncharacterized protein DUF4230